MPPDGQGQARGLREITLGSWDKPYMGDAPGMPPQLPEELQSPESQQAYYQAYQQGMNPPVDPTGIDPDPQGIAGGPMLPSGLRIGEEVMRQAFQEQQPLSTLSPKTQQSKMIRQFARTDRTPVEETLGVMWQAPPGSQPFIPLEEEHPDAGAWQRFKSKNFGTTVDAMKGSYEKMGFQAKKLPSNVEGGWADEAAQGYGMNLAIKLPHETDWRVVDPATFEAFDDLTDIGTDIAIAVGSFMAASSGVGLLPASLGGMASTAGRTTVVQAGRLAGQRAAFASIRASITAEGGVGAIASAVARKKIVKVATKEARVAALNAMKIAASELPKSGLKGMAARMGTAAVSAQAGVVPIELGRQAIGSAMGFENDPEILKWHLLTEMAFSAAFEGTIGNLLRSRMGFAGLKKFSSKAEVRLRHGKPPPGGYDITGGGGGRPPGGGGGGAGIGPGGEIIAEVGDKAAIRSALKAQKKLLQSRGNALSKAETSEAKKAIQGQIQSIEREIEELGAQLVDVEGPGRTIFGRKREKPIDVWYDDETVKALRGQQQLDDQLATEAATKLAAERAAEDDIARSAKDELFPPEREALDPGDLDIGANERASTQVSDAELNQLHSEGFELIRLDDGIAVPREARGKFYNKKTGEVVRIVEREGKLTVEAVKSGVRGDPYKPGGGPKTKEAEKFVQQHSRKTVEEMSRQGSREPAGGESKIVDDPIYQREGQRTTTTGHEATQREVSRVNELRDRLNVIDDEMEKLGVQEGVELERIPSVGEDAKITQEIKSLGEKIALREKDLARMKVEKQAGRVFEEDVRPGAYRQHRMGTKGKGKARRAKGKDRAREREQVRLAEEELKLDRARVDELYDQQAGRRADPKTQKKIDELIGEREARLKEMREGGPKEEKEFGKAAAKEYEYSVQERVERAGKDIEAVEKQAAKSKENLAEFEAAERETAQYLRKDRKMLERKRAELELEAEGKMDGGRAAQHKKEYKAVMDRLSQIREQIPKAQESAARARDFYATGTEEKTYRPSGGGQARDFVPEKVINARRAAAKRKAQRGRGQKGKKVEKFERIPTGKEERAAHFEKIKATEKKAKLKPVEDKGYNRVKGQSTEKGAIDIKNLEDQIKILETQMKDPRMKGLTSAKTRIQKALNKARRELKGMRRAHNENIRLAKEKADAKKIEEDLKKLRDELRDCP